MKILIITDAWHPQTNGVVRTYEYLTRELEKQGHGTKVISPADFKRRIPMPGYSEIELVLFPYRKMAKMIEIFSPDSIHIATEGPLGWAARKYCLKHDTPFTSSYHSQFPDYVAKRVACVFPFFYKSVHKICLDMIRRFHAPSGALLITTESMAKQLREWDIKATIYPFTRGIDESLFYINDAALLQDLPKPISLYVGRIAIEKNIEEFLEMNWNGSKVVVGHGPDLDMLKKKYPEVLFTGKKTGKELADHYRAADVFVFPSYTDTFGIVIIEALSCGLPVAAHDVIGPRDIIKEDILGCLDEDLSKAAHKALENGTKQQRHDYVAAHYTWSAAVDQFLYATHKAIGT